MSLPKSRSRNAADLTTSAPNGRTFPACQEKTGGEQPCISTAHARITLTIYRSQLPLSSRPQVSSMVRHRSRMEAVVSGTVNPDVGVSRQPASRTADNNLAGGKSEKKGPKNLQPILATHSKHSNIRGTKPKTKPFLM
jgi:hypothetical protein